ncbi:hypothetical protein SRB5_17140 [Streptomyces sp. RB5]|uniref:Uncharacterized protein n=1 Tax=Streptomyces smaragdinus TaxID=2585196 RepID=A0A7K0CDQ7_9ACTN|nr:hypothetical protein [Streptomyces smaragdinus]
MTCSSSSRAIGRIFAACTIAESRPAFTHSSRNTEFSTMRAAGFRPKEMFDRPRVVCTSGWRRLSSRIASIVAIPSLRDSSCPVQMVKVRQSIRMSDSFTPQFPVRSSISRSAMATLCSGVRAWPCSSIVSAISAAPCSTASPVIFWNRDSGPSPSS